MSTDNLILDIEKEFDGKLFDRMFADGYVLINNITSEEKEKVIEKCQHLFETNLLRLEDGVLYGKIGFKFTELSTIPGKFVKWSYEEETKEDFIKRMMAPDPEVERICEEGYNVWGKLLPKESERLSKECLGLFTRGLLRINNNVLYERKNFHFKFPWHQANGKTISGSQTEYFGTEEYQHKQMKKLFKRNYIKVVLAYIRVYWERLMYRISLTGYKSKLEETSI